MTSNAPSRAPRRPRSRVASWLLLCVAIALAVGLALLGYLNRRSVERAAAQAYEGRALDIGLSTAAVLWAIRPRGPEALQGALTSMKEGPIRSVAVVAAKGRVLGSSDPKERGTLTTPDPQLDRLLRGEAVHRIRRIADGDAPRYEVWLVLRPGMRRFHRGPPPGAGWGRRRRRERWKRMHREGRVPWGRSFLRVRLEVSDPPIAAAVNRARGVQWATLVGAGLLLALALLAFLADRRAARFQRRMVAQQRLAEMGEMAAVLAHEIRNPLGVIKGYAQLLGEKEQGEGRETLERVVSETGRLERLVNALLDYARPVPARFEDTDLPPLVDRGCELVAGEAQARGVRLIRDLQPCRARVDGDQVLQVVLNLLRNAVQVSPADATVTLRLERRGAQVRLEVRDAGPGLPPELGDDIFKPFVTTRADGTGLGLAISRRIAEAHGGHLTASRLRDGGSDFVLTLPVAGPAPEAAP